MRKTKFILKQQSPLKESKNILENSDNLIDQLIEQSTDIIIITNSKNKILFFNKAAQLELGFSKKYLLGKDISVLSTTELVVKKSKTNNLKKEVLLNTKDGKKLDCLLTKKPIKKGIKITGSINLYKNISTIKEIDKNKRVQNEKIRVIFESGKHLFWSINNSFELISFNKNYSKAIKILYGSSPKIGGHFKPQGHNFNNGDVLKFWKKKYELAFTGEPQQFTTKNYDEKRKENIREIYLTPIKDPDNPNKITQVSGIAHDITEKEIAERNLREQAAKIKSVFESTAIMIWTIDETNRITSFNSFFYEEAVRYFKKRIEKKDDFFKYINPFCSPEKYTELLEFYKKARGGLKQQFEIALINHKGEEIWIETFLNPILYDSGQVHEVACMANNITEKKRYLKQINESLKEKEILLQEVHHRVKNNLQVISSILNLQTSYVDDARTKEILQESQNRIKSMAFIHESLYQNKDFSRVDFSEYILALSKNLLHSYNINRDAVELTTKFDKVSLSLDQAIPCGLIVNELITNALKYAFPKNREGKIEVLINHKKGQICIVVKDNGVGIPKDFNFEASNTLGLQLVFTLVEQLDAKIKYNTNHGTKFLITFNRQ
jgi:PAS domain S-box-containing protein